MRLYSKQFHVFCICSIIALTLLSLHRLSSTLQLPSVQRLFGGTNEDEWRDFVNDYERRFQRGPPPAGFYAWFKFATENQCETRCFYESLDNDLAYFRNINNKTSSLLQWERVLPEGSNKTDNYIAFALENHELKVIAFPTYKLHEERILRLYEWLFKPLMNHSPPLYSRFILNLHDIGTVWPKSVVHAQPYPMFSFCKMDYYTDHQNPPPPSFLSKKHSDNLVQAYATDLFSKQPKEPRRTDTTADIIDNDFVQSKDLLVPFHFSMEWRSQDHPEKTSKKTSKKKHQKEHGPPPFARRKNVITWRGSTTGPWETGSRFKLIKEFGGRGIHPLSSSKTTGGGDGSGNVVNADFAFVTVVQQPQHAANLSREVYRFAPYMVYHEMQQNKYILDIDGNGYTGRFPGLLRSGSLVFKSTRYREWFHGRLLPYIDYIPVNVDLTDLVEKVEWVHNQHDTRMAERIVKHSREQVDQLFRPVEMQCYMYRLLLEYQTLFEKPPP